MRPGLLGELRAVEPEIGPGQNLARPVLMIGQRPDARFQIQARLAVGPRPSLTQIVAEPHRHAGRADAHRRIHGFLRSCAGSPARLSADASSGRGRSEEHTSELQSLMRTSYAVFCLKKKKF